MSDWRDFVMDKAAEPYKEAARQWMLRRLAEESLERAQIPADRTDDQE